MKKLLIAVLFILMSSFLNAAYYYGAIAINPQTGSTGYSYDYGSRYNAERAALNYCKGSCRIAVYFWNTCASVAWSPRTKAYGWYYAGNMSETKRGAVRKCGYSDCRVVSSVCTTR